MNLAASRKVSILLTGLLLFVLAPVSQAKSNILHQYDVLDLSHMVPVFEPLNGDVRKSDLSKPVANSQPVAGSGDSLGVRIAKPPMKVMHGTVQWGFLYLDEHYSTHVDSTNHFITTDKSVQALSNPDQRDVGQYSVNELIGAIVYIDISDRVRKELGKNGGKPSVDRRITNFDDDMRISVMASDIDAIANQLVDGAYLVINTGWEQFYIGLPPPGGGNWAHPYNNNFNYPGLSREATQRLVEIEEQRGIRIGGIVADNISVESGHSVRGAMGTEQINVSNLVMYMHAVGLGRGWKIVENAANLSVLKNYQAGTCDLVIGAPKIIGASGTPVRLMAICEKNTALLSKKMLQ